MTPYTFRFLIILAFFSLGAFYISLPLRRRISMALKGRLRGSFRCRRCGRCCSSFRRICLNEADAARIEALGYRRPYFLGIAFGSGPVMKRRNGACIFLRKAGRLFSCSINGTKPDVCRRWPFRTISILGKEITYVSTRFRCPALQGGRACLSHAAPSCGRSTVPELSLKTA